MANKYTIKHRRLALFKHFSGKKCPVCFDDSLFYDDHIDYHWWGGMSRCVTCNNCESSWIEHYAVTAFSTVKLGNEAKHYVTKQRKNWKEKKPIDDNLLTD